MMIAQPTELELELGEKYAHIARQNSPADNLAAILANALAAHRVHTIVAVATAERGALLALEPAAPQPDAPTDVAALPDYWDERRRKQGKPDLSRCAAELRIALAKVQP